MATIVEWTSVLFAFLAAFFWGWSTFVNLPIIGSSYGAIANLEPFYAALKKVAQLNAMAAGCGFIAAAAQALVFLTAKGP